MDLLPVAALTLAILTAATALAVPAYFGSRKPGYSHVRHTISELGEAGSPVGWSVSYLGFMSTGISLWLFLIAVAEASPRAADDGFWMLAWRNTLHNVLGALEYVGAAAAFSTLRFTQFWSPLSNLMSFAAGLVLLCLWGMSFPHPFRGLVQRVAETTIFAGVVTMGWCVYRASA